MDYFQCAHCEKKYAEKRGLKRHYIKHHDSNIPDGFESMGNRKHPCPNCGAQVSNPSAHKKSCPIEKAKFRTPSKQPVPSTSRALTLSPTTGLAQLSMNEEVYAGATSAGASASASASTSASTSTLGTVAFSSV